MTFDSITNRAEFFSSHYLDTVIGSDLGDLRKTWDEHEKKGEPTARSRIKSLPQQFFTARAAAAEASAANRPIAVRHLNDLVLTALGFTPHRTALEFKRNTEDRVTVPVAAQVETGTGLLLVAIEAGLAGSVDELSNFDERQLFAVEQPGQLLSAVFRESDKKAVHGAIAAIGEIFSTDEPPRYVIVLGGATVLLAERAKWAEGRSLAVDLDAALERNNTKAKGELETIVSLFSADAIVPGGLDGSDGQSFLEVLADKSHKHAVGVSEDLKVGIRESIEILANEVIDQADNKAKQGHKKQFTNTDVDAKKLTSETLRYLYRLVVLLYAESRPELGILPTDDEAYMDGYSLDRLRELCLVELNDDKARNGSHLHESLQLLFRLVNDGYHAESAEQQLDLMARPVGSRSSREEYLQFPGLDAHLFGKSATELIDSVTLRNEALQKILQNLMLASGKKRNDSAGFISYAQLGINQLGAVYEGLMAYKGFFAGSDLYEVAKNGDPHDGSWMLPVEDADEYPDDVFVAEIDEVTGQPERKIHRRGEFVFRLAGRDRQRSASYYTPEVLTRCVVKHSLAELLGLDDYAPENGSSGITQAVDLLDITICEPALGSGAFANEAINQLAAEYLKRRSAELDETLDADRYLQELQKVKAHFALHQTYGVDLNATAIELAEVSLWLNSMYPGLKAPWFGLQLRAGNSLVGCRRATWKVSQLAERPWAQTKKTKLQPPVDRKLNEPLVVEGPNAEIHHFLLPGHGWAAVAGRKEAKELRPDEAQGLKDWRKTVLAAPSKADAERLVQLSAGVESMWADATERIRLIQQALCREVDVYGIEQQTRSNIEVSRVAAAKALADADSPLGRLRTLMDAWVGLWFWPLDSGVTPPTWAQWLQVAEELVRPDQRHGLTGQLDLFDDLPSLLKAEQTSRQGQVTVAELREDHPWLAVALDAAEDAGAWHWELEFAPVFEQGGFDLQVGNPPWVRPIWKDDLVLAESDPWWGVTSKPGAAVIKDRRAVNLSEPRTQASYLAELSSGEGMVEFLGSPVMRPVLAGIQTNLYMVFMDTTWRHLNPRGTVGLLHPESHFTDPKGGLIRRAAYEHLQRHWQFANGLFLFEDINDKNVFGIHIYGSRTGPNFAKMSMLQHPDIVDKSLEHSGAGELPGIQYPWGGWDLRPHRARVLTITQEVLADWARLFDEPGTPAAEARLLRPVTSSDLEALSVLADQPTRLADHDYHWTAGWHEKGAKTDGTIRWETAVPDSWDDVILQGPHFSVATPFNKQPNENCKHNQDYRDWDLENLPKRVIPRTNYQRATDRPTYDSRLDQWNNKPATDHWRVAWRAMTQPGLERSFHAVVLPIKAAHTNGTFAASIGSTVQTVAASGLWSAIPVDYLVKVAGAANLHDSVVAKFPTPKVESVFRRSLLLRTLRLNCMTADYAPLWEELFDPSWKQDRWTDAEFDRLDLGDVEPKWTMDTPLRRDEDRRRALVELDALAALMLGLSAEQLCAMYRTQFAVLRKYEYKMVFDAEGRKICGHHQSAGFRQAELQDQAKAGDLPTEWKNVWKLYEQYEEAESGQDAEPVDWLGHFTPPFRKADRETEMTLAYNEFRRRLNAGECEKPKG